MTETRKKLRILAAVFLLISATLSFGSIVLTFFSGGLSGRISFFQAYWPSLLTFVLNITIAIFIFTRCYVGAGIAECVFAAVALISLISNIISFRRGYLPAAYNVMSVLCSLLAIGGDVLLLIAFFKRNRSSKPLFILGGILLCLSAVLSAAQSALLPVMDGFGASAASVIGVLIGGLLAGALCLLPWLFLGLYFGARKTDTQGWSAPAPQQWADPAPQQWADPALQQEADPEPAPQNSSGPWKPYP